MGINYLPNSTGDRGISEPSTARITWQEAVPADRTRADTRHGGLILMTFEGLWGESLAEWYDISTEWFLLLDHVFMLVYIHSYIDSIYILSVLV